MAPKPVQELVQIIGQEIAQNGTSREEIQRMNRLERVLRSLIWLSCTGLIFQASAALAQWEDEEDDVDFAASGPYVGLAWVVAAPTNFQSTIGQPFEKTNGYTNVQNVKSTGNGLQFRLGARAIDWLAYELQFEWITNVDFDSDQGHADPEIFTTTVNAKIFAFHALLNGVHQGRIQPYLIGGIGALAAANTDISTAVAFAGRAGMGIDYFLSDAFSVNLDGAYVWPIQNLAGMEYFSIGLGLRYHF
jgi:hypothetical protein